MDVPWILHHHSPLAEWNDHDDDDEDGRDDDDDDDDDDDHGSVVTGPYRPRCFEEEKVEIYWSPKVTVSMATFQINDALSGRDRVLVIKGS